MTRIPVIDIFAGPGGLSEGFSAVRVRRTQYFDVLLSIEKDRYAYETLLLRSFFRKFKPGKAPEEYYACLRGEISRENLYELAKKKYPYEIGMAEKMVWQAELGKGDNIDSELDKRIKDVVGRKPKWVLIGGPPCQAYSIIGRARNSGNAEYEFEKDNKTHLYKEYLKILARHKPTVFLMENVKGILSSRLNGERIIDRIIHDLEYPSEVHKGHGEVSYRIFSLIRKNEHVSGSSSPLRLMPSDFVVECEKFGIPQRRHRVILLGIRKDKLTRALPGTLSESESLSVGDMIRDLPPLRSGLSREDDTVEAWRATLKRMTSSEWFKEIEKIAGREVYDIMKKSAKSPINPEYGRGGNFIKCDHQLENERLSKWFVDPKLKGVCNHATKAHMVEDIYRYLFVSSFGEYYGRSPQLDEFPPDLLPNHRNVGTGNFSDRFRVQLWKDPSTTVTSHLSKDGHYFIHPDPKQCRSLTVREAARLQTFPDNYYFCGGVTQQYKQVGNAVPPLLAKSIAEIVKDFLDRL